MGLFSSQLQSKIDLLSQKRQAVTMGKITFASPLVLAPMAAICSAPFRLLMEQLGAGATVSELISCHGINFNNQRTMEMLKIDPRENIVGIQLFGEDGETIARSCERVQKFGPKFIDINMGCPVKKVVSKGGGSALLQNPEKLGAFFAAIKKELSVPLTIKIRTGWDQDHVNADQVIEVAQSAGVEFVAIHGRTRTQQYSGKADWDYLESLNHNSPLPLIGNGDLHQVHQVQERLLKTQCKALMIARGALRNPFIFLEGLDREGQVEFTAQDHWEVTKVLADLVQNWFPNPRIQLVQMRKHILWFVSGFPNSSHFRGRLFEIQEYPEMIKVSEEFFQSLGSRTKMIDYGQEFMTSGHG